MVGVEKDASKRGSAPDLSSRVTESLFPVRFLGFGFFWAWLFLAGVTPSPLIGTPLCFAGAPFEMVELSVRALVLAAVLVASRQLASVAGQRGLLVLGVAASAVAAPLVLAVGGAGAASGAAVAAAIGEVCMFLLWLCFFGYMKVGETFALLVGSYAIGSVLFLLTAALGHNAMAAASVLFPALSGTAFVLSQRLMKARTGEELFVKEAILGEGAQEVEKAMELPPDVAAPRHGAAGGKESPVRQKARIGAALALYSLSFSLSCGISLFGGGGMIGAFTVEPAAMIVLGVICAAFFKFDHQPDRPYKLYRAVAPLIGFGFLLMAVSPLPDEVGGFCVALGYVLFELLVLNDCCNIVKANDASLLRVMAAARLAITLGMFLGWLTAFACASLVGVAESVSSLVALGLFAALISVSLVFTEHDRASVAAVADDRALSEGALAGPTREEAFAAFSEERGLSRREAEVASYLLAGRTTSFAAEKLFIAESTVRAHVHSIYRKCGVHSRMELMDAFDECWLRGDSNL